MAKKEAAGSKPSKAAQCTKDRYVKKRHKYKRKIEDLQVPCAAVVLVLLHHLASRQPELRLHWLMSHRERLQGQLGQLQDRLKREEALNSKYFDCLEQQGLLCGICMEGAQSAPLVAATMYYGSQVYTVAFHDLHALPGEDSGADYAGCAELLLLLCF